MFYLGIGFLAILLMIARLVYLYYHFDTGQIPQPADIILVAEGPAPERSDQAVDLLRAGYSQTGYLLVSPRHAREDFDIFPTYVKKGAPPESLVAEDQATSTWTNAVHSLAIMADRGWTSANVVTSDYHMRRTMLTFRRANRQYGFDLTFVSAHRDGHGYRATPNGRRMARMEVLKWIGYRLYLYHWIDW